MKTLTVDNFSCIKTARLEIDKLTVIIGPQASGKSVLGKLTFFALDISQSQYYSILRQESIEKFTNNIKEKFIEWFPIGAWGAGKFKINFTSGNYSITIARRTYKKENKDSFSIKFSENFIEKYNECLTFRDAKKTKYEDHLMFEPERDWRIREMINECNRELQGKDYIQHQNFIPAGRSFFTSIGKAIAAFEQGRVLDPLILRFGRIYSNYKNQPIYWKDRGSFDKETRTIVENIMESLLGGKIQQDGEKEYVLTHDKRKIPLTALSSGQQEILPLIAVLPWFYHGGKDDFLCYIEEPEAHLFPSTQSKLIQALVILAHSLNLVITTHSPYVLTKLNNLLKAGALGRKRNEALKSELEKLIPRKAWLSSRIVKAYALKDGVLEPIIGSDGFIDAEYLDSISDDLSSEFNKLLSLEAKNV